MGSDWLFSGFRAPKAYQRKYLRALTFISSQSTHSRLPLHKISESQFNSFLKYWRSKFYGIFIKWGQFIDFSALNAHNSFWLDFFTHKAILFRDQYEISRRLVYHMTTFGGTAQATIFHALLGVSRENDHAPMRASKFFWISMAHLGRIKSQNNWAVMCTRKLPQRLHYKFWWIKW